MEWNLASWRRRNMVGIFFFNKWINKFWVNSMKAAVLYILRYILLQVELKIKQLTSIHERAFIHHTVEIVSTWNTLFQWINLTHLPALIVYCSVGHEILVQRGAHSHACARGGVQKSDKWSLVICHWWPLWISTLSRPLYVYLAEGGCLQKYSLPKLAMLFLLLFLLSRYTSKRYMTRCIID